MRVRGVSVAVDAVPCPPSASAVLTPPVSLSPRQGAVDDDPIVDVRCVGCGGGVFQSGAQLDLVSGRWVHVGCFTYLRLWRDIDARDAVGSGR